MQPLTSAADIRAVFATRRVVSVTVASLHHRRRDDDGPARAAVVAGRRLGNAVHRNRAKRRLRAALRDVTLPAGTDVVVVARAAAIVVPFPTLVDQLRSAAVRMVATVHAAA